MHAEPTPLFSQPPTHTPTAPATQNYTGIGAAAEHLLVARLLQRGHKVAIPVADDDGVVSVAARAALDLDLDPVVDDEVGSLKVCVAAKTRGTDRNRKRGLADHVDLVAIYARDTDAWFFVPREHIPNGRTISVSENARVGTSVWRDAWDTFGTAPDQPAANAA